MGNVPSADRSVNVTFQNVNCDSTSRSTYVTNVQQAIRSALPNATLSFNMSSFETINRVNYTTVYYDCVPNACASLRAAFAANVTNAAMNGTAGCPGAQLVGTSFVYPDSRYCEERLQLEKLGGNPLNAIAALAGGGGKLSDTTCSLCFEQNSICLKSLTEGSSDRIPMTECGAADNGYCQLEGVWKIILIVTASVVVVVAVIVALCCQCSKARAKKQEDAEVGAYTRMRLTYAAPRVLEH